MADVLRFSDLRSFCSWAQIPLPRLFDPSGSGGFFDLGQTWVEDGRTHKGWHVMCLDSGHLVASEQAFAADSGPVRYLGRAADIHVAVAVANDLRAVIPPRLDDLAEALRPHLSEDSSGSTQ